MSTNSKKNEINFNVEIGDDTSDKKHIFDLNKIFHIDLSYNFDLLKNLLLTLIKNQKEKENKITELENQILDLRIAFSEGSIKKSDEKNKEEEKVNKKEETIEKKEPKGESENQNKDTINYKINPPIKGPKLEISDENSPIINKIIKKINGIDEYLNDTYKVIPELQKVTNEDKVRINILEENNEILEKKIEEFNSKLQDFNIADMLKNNIMNIEGDEGNNSVVLNLVSNLEKKFNSKNKINDDRLNKLEENNFKALKDIQNIKNIQDSTKRNINTLKQTNENIVTNIKNLESNMRKIIPELEQKIEIENKLIHQESMKEREESPKKENIIDESQRKESLLSNLKIDSNEINLENNEKIKEINNRLLEIEKNIRMIPNQIGIEQIKLDISALKSGIRSCALANDLKESKEKEEDLQKQINFIKEQFEDFISNNADHEDIQNIKRKLELINSKLHEAEENYQNINNKLSINNKNKTNITTYDKYLETQIFDNFKNQIIKEFSSVNDNFTHLRRLVDNILESLKNKPSYRDIKALDEELNIKLEELKVLSEKKYAERIETTKNFKYLDTQIKNILQIYIKKEKRSENWLLAKKPMTNLCASCEAYIGELKDNNNYQPWNKYPLKDPNDKIYRLGNGFSKMLQMVQLDENDKKNTGMVTQQNNEFNIGNKLLKLDKIDSNFNNNNDLINIGPFKTDINNSNNNKLLPKIKGNNTGNNFNKNKQKNILKENNNNEHFEEEEYNEDDKEPKIVKITKINKE